MTQPHRVAIEFQILRSAEANARIEIPCLREPKLVATMINEPVFNREQAIDHNVTVFVEDRYHDWSWQHGMLRYYSRVAPVADVLLVFEFA